MIIIKVAYESEKIQKQRSRIIRYTVKKSQQIAI